MTILLCNVYAQQVDLFYVLQVVALSALYIFVTYMLSYQL